MTVTMWTGVIVGAWIAYCVIPAINEWLDGPADYETLRKMRESKEFDQLYGPKD